MFLGRTRSRHLVAVAAFALVVSACGGGETATPSATPAPGPAPAPAPVDSVDRDAYYFGKVVEVLVPTSPGGGTDGQARFFVPFLQKHIPGQPAVGVTNTGGSSGILGGNSYKNDRIAEDALSVFYSSGSHLLPWVFGTPALRLDYASDLYPLAISGTGGAVYVRTDTGVSSPADFAQAVKSGSVKWERAENAAAGVGLVFLLMDVILGMEVNTVFGFGGRGQVRLAIEQGVSNISWDTTTAMLAQVQELENAKVVTPVFSVGFPQPDGTLARDPNFPDLPSFSEMYELVHGSLPSGLEYEALIALIAPAFSSQKILWVHAAAPDDKKALLRQAMVDMANDPDFNEQAPRVLGEGYPFVTGDAVDEGAAAILGFRPDLRDFILDFLVNGYDYRDPR